MIKNKAECRRSPWCTRAVLSGQLPLLPAAATAYLSPQAVQEGAHA